MIPSSHIIGLGASFGFFNPVARGFCDPVIGHENCLITTFGELVIGETVAAEFATDPVLELE